MNLKIFFSVPPKDILNCVRVNISAVNSDYYYYNIFKFAMSKQILTLTGFVPKYTIRQGVEFYSWFIDSEAQK